MYSYSKTIARVSSFVLALCLVTTVGTGCATEAKSGALTGGGIGALAGLAMGGSTESALIGAAVGSGVGYVIGNKKDKKHAETMSRGQESLPAYAHDEVGSLGGSRWMLISLAPSDAAPPFLSKIVQFQPDGRMYTTTTNPDRSIDVFNERYRVVGKTLIINKPGYIINAEFRISDNEMIVDAESFRAVLRRLES